MANKPVFNFNKITRQHFLVGLFVVVAAGALVYWKNSSNPPQAIESSANEERAHWAHSTIPFQLPIVNMASGKWRNHLNTITGKWGESNMVSYQIVRDSTRQACDMFSEGMKICSYSANDGYTGGAVYVQGPYSSHIRGATIRMNDFYYFGKGQSLNSDAWRNHDLCWLMGFTLGIATEVDGSPNVTSCMNLWTTSENVASRQFPDQNDHIEMREIYNHKDDTSSSSVGYKLDTANQFFSKNQLGVLDSATSTGSSELYQLDLGDGYTMITILKKSK